MSQKRHRFTNNQLRNTYKNPFFAVVSAILIAITSWFVNHQRHVNTSLVSSNQQSANQNSTRVFDLIISNVTVYDLNGRVAYQGDMDLRPTLARIKLGQRDSHRNDGSVYRNRDQQLPRHDRNYYHEYVVRTPKLRSVGPQRLIMGNGNEAYYTSDHYQHFTRVQ